MTSLEMDYVTGVASYGCEREPPGSNRHASVSSCTPVERIACKGEEPWRAAVCFVSVPSIVT